MASFFGIFLAIILHLAVLLFGGWFFLDEKEKHGTVQEVELISDIEAEAKKEEEKEKPKEEETEKIEELKAETEEAPDSAEIMRNLELSAAAAAPALEAASLSAIEQALSGTGGGGGEFADALSFSSGGRIGGMGKAIAGGDQFEAAFSLSEIDQKPRVLFQTAATYPSEMRGKKMEGVVTLIFVVDSSGKVINPRVEKSTHPAFEKPALDAVRQWKFEPAVKAGQRVSCKMRAPIRFQPS